MSKFIDLSESQKIEYIKESFISIIEFLVKDPNKLSLFIQNTDDEKVNKIKNILNSLKKKDGCSCGSCLDLDFFNKEIPVELEPLIDAAKTEAQNKVY